MQRLSSGTSSRLPAGRHLAVTWGIPDHYGGMTNAMLHRSRAFVRHGEVEVDVVTFDERPDYPQLEERLLGTGELIPGMRVVNLWDWLRGNPLPGGSLSLSRHPLDPIDLERDADEIDPPRERDGIALSRRRRAPDGTTLQVDHYRLDGTLLASDRRDVRVRGTVGGRSVVLCDAQGQPVRSWGRIRSLYAAWLDALTAGRKTWLIIDSKTTATSLLEYRRPKVVTTHVVHASHLVGQKRPMGTLRESRRQVFENLSDFDCVVVLTERQRQDVVDLLGEQPNLAVVPNARDLGDLDPDAPTPPRDPGRGIVLASLTRRKRVDHAIRAVAAAGRPEAGGAGTAAPGAAAPTLDIYGDGELRDDLQRRIDEEQLGSRVHLHGFVPDAAQRLSEASYLLLTSTSEGFALVLVESLAAGCIPIAYDIPYGPGDIIEDGRSGFLVPAGDVEALAATVARVVAMPEAELEGMRRSARRSALRFSDGQITAQWARVLRRADDAKQYRELHGSAPVSEGRARLSAVARALRGRLAGLRRRLSRPRPPRG